MDIDNYFAYAHTLSGHEASHSEDLEKAVQCFRQALLCDERNYSAWYGLGSIYSRQGRLELAEHHFRRGLAINSASGAMHCHLGMVLHEQGTPAKIDEAYAVLSKGCAVDSSNANIHFEKANVLVTKEEYEEALSELEIVRDLAPREPPVYILLGQVCMKLMRNTEAVFYFNIACDLDPKEAGAIKKFMEDIEDPELDMESYLEERDACGDVSVSVSVSEDDGGELSMHMSMDTSGDSAGSNTIMGM